MEIWHTRFNFTEICLLTNTPAPRRLANIAKNHFPGGHFKSYETETRAREDQPNQSRRK